MSARVSKVRRVVETLRGEIHSGLYESSQFPSVVRLMRRFDLARATAVRVVETLKGEKLVVSRPGKGTFATDCTRRSGGAIGLIVPGVCYSEIFQPICRRISQLAQERGLSLFFGGISSSDPVLRARQAVQLARKFVSERVAGVLLQPIEFHADAVRINREIVEAFRSASIPVVLIDNDIELSPERSPLDVVGINCLDSGRVLATHLVKAGARNLCFLMRPDWANSLKNRLAGVRSALPKGARLTVSSVDPKDAKGVTKLISGRGRPDAILCRNDVDAAHLLATLHRLGKRVPADMMVTGFNDLGYAGLVTPPLTSVRMPVDDVAETAFRALMERMERPSLPPREIFLPAPLVVRESTMRTGTPKGRLQTKGIKR